ncbi:MAG: ABC transporter ATP-binding protein [Planctomycetota bacterium]|nr:ABC transporter ATP-binding protein [Planctomycetota bacterium]
MTTIVSANDVYKFFGKGASQTAVLREVDFQVAEGEFVCIMGPSGSGKSTLLHLVSGLDELSAGEIELFGQNLAALTQHQRTLLRRQSIGYVFQFFNLLPNLTVLENVGLPLAIQGRRPKAESGMVLGLLNRFGLSERASAFPHQISGGQMQHTSIARALAGGQPLLLCDEPTGNLSQKAGLEVMQTLRRVCDNDGRSVLLVTHNPRDAGFADRVLFLVDGELKKEPVLEGPDIPVQRIHETLAALSI